MDAVNLTSPTQVRALLEEKGLHPNRVLGQNFLVDRNILDCLLRAAALERADHVLEIGPGLGVVTEALLQQVDRVTAIEKDGCLYGILQERWGAEPRLELIHADALDIPVPELTARGISVLVANLPYSVGTRILMALATADAPLERMVVTVQLEVGQRLAAAAGGEHRGLVSVWVQQRYDVERVHTVSPTCFWPRPDVRSAIVTLHRHHRHDQAGPVEDCFRALTRHAFMHRRKQMPAIFRRGPDGLRFPAETMQGLLQACGVDPRARPETLTVGQWCDLARRILTRGPVSDVEARDP
jgi:16S rRNA (adenine1518-N6/adenine1519-N6)-dimethyltransferase